MDLSNYFLFGYIKKPVHHNGEVIVFLDVDNAAAYKKIKSFFVEMPTGLVPFFIEKIQIRDNHDAIVKLENIDDENNAISLKGKKLWLPIEQLPKLTGNRFYFHEIIGWHVIDTKEGNIGIIKDVLDNTMQPLFQIIHPSGKEVLVPIHDDILKKVDRVNNCIEIIAPEGLLELYFSS